MSPMLARAAGLLAAASLVALAAPPARAADPSAKCGAAKLAAAARYAQCRLAAESAALKKGATAAFGKCDAGLLNAWSSSEAAGDGACPTEGDLGPVQAALTYEADRFALSLSGTNPLAASRTPASGQTTAYTADKNDGIPGAVPVADDGTLRAGAALSYVDNGDGTITDLVTGLMWEKKGDDDDGLHGWRRYLPWSGDGSEETIWDWLDDVNSEGGTGFAGHSDWRIPTVKELITIVDYARFNPSVDPIFHTGCVPGCAVTTCSCMAFSSFHWSASTFEYDPSRAWCVEFGAGNALVDVKDDLGRFVRAVRGGL